MRKLLFFGLAGLLLLALTLATLLLTGPGFRLLLKLAPVAGVTVEYADAKGSLADFELIDLRIEAAGTHIDADRIALAWRPLDLLKRHVAVSRLEATALKVRLPPPAEQPAPSAPLDLSQGLALPVTVQVTALAIDGIEVTADGEPLVALINAEINDLQLNSERWQIQQLAARAEAWGASMSGGLSPGADLAHELSAQMQLGADAATVSVTGNADQTRIELDLNQAQVVANARLNSWTTDPAWQVTVRATDFRGITSVDFNGAGDLQAGQGSAQAVMDGRTVDLRQWRYSRTNLAHWRVHLDAHSAPVSVVADLELDAGQIYSAQVDLTPDDPTLPNAALTVSGPFTLLGFRADLQLPQAGVTGAGDLSLQGSLQDFNTVQIDALDGQLLGGSVTGTGNVGFAQGLAANLDLQLDRLELSRLAPNLPDQVGGQVTVQTTRPGGTLATRLDLALTAMQAGTPLSITGQASLVDAQPVAANLILRATDANQIDIQLSDSQTVQLVLDVAQPDLFMPGLGGQIEGDVLVRLGGRWPQAKGRISAVALELPDTVALGRVQLDLDFDRLTLAAESLVVAGQQLETVSLDLTGQPESHHYELKASAAQGQLELTGDGELAGDEYRFAIDRLMAQLPRDQAVSNEQPIRGVISPILQQLDNSCLGNSDIRLCVSATRENDMTTGALSVQSAAIEQLPWRELQPGLEKVLLPSGALAIDLKAQANGNAVSLDGRLDLASLRVEDAGGDGLAVDRIAVTAAGSPAQADVTLSAQLPGGELTAQAVLRNLDQDATVTASGRASLADVAVLSVLIPDAQLERGSALIEFAASGALAAPDVSGSIALTGVGADLPQLGIKPDLNLTITLPDDGQGRFEGTMASGTGSATLSGDASWDGALTLHGQLEGKQLLVANTETLSVSASPAINIDIDDTLTRIGGRIVVDRGYVALTTGTSGGPSASADVIIVDADAEERPAHPSRVALDLRIELDQPVDINGFGLTGKLAGQITLKQQPGGPLLANGELNLTGQYAAFGQKLTINEGRLIYVNTPLEDPVIELYAGREIDDTKVGVRVTGRVSSLSAKLESVPAMNESDQLSLLVLGRLPGTLDESQSDQLATAAMSLALSQGNRALGGLGGGMPSLSLTQELGGLAVAIGKQLSPRLYVGYTVDLLKPVQLVRLRYRISDSWTAETELGLESRSAIRYRRER